EGGVLIANLRINGVFIPISGVNQTINLPGGGFVIINEQIRTGGGSSAAITVNGVRVFIPGVANVILASAYSAINCGTSPNGQSQ
ncbi:MAG: hypothetical protein LC776_07360, partial [Acidobacteria bacterium]|nr:hypothetical protein [Acidobacteriota bacterium]